MTGKIRHGDFKWCSYSHLSKASESQAGIWTTSPPCHSTDYKQSPSLSHFLSQSKRSDKSKQRREKKQAWQKRRRPFSLLICPNVFFPLPVKHNCFTGSFCLCNERGSLISASSKHSPLRVVSWHRKDGEQRC